MENREQVDPTGVLEGHSTHKNYFPKEDEKKLVSNLRERFREAEEARRPWETDSNFYLNYLQGEQLIVRNKTTNEVLRINLANKNPRIRHSIDNVMRPAARALAGKLSRVIPTCTVSPRTDDRTEIKAAYIATSLLDFIRRKEKLDQKFLNANNQLSWSGKAVFQLLWNKDAGRELGWCGECLYVGEPSEIGAPCPQCSLAQQQAAMMGQPVEQEQSILEPVQEGDVEVRLLDPRDFYPEPGVARIEDLRWYCVRTAQPVSKLRKTFPEHAEHIHSEGGIYADKVLNAFGTSYTVSANLDALADHAYLHEFFELPTESYPDGRYIAMVNDLIAFQGPAPYKELGRMNVYTFEWEPIEGSFWGESPSAQAWHIQRERNELLTDLRTNRSLGNKPRLLNPITSRINKSEFDDNPNRIIDYNPMGGTPKYLESAPFAQYTYAELDRMEAAVNKKFCVTPQDLGDVEPESSGRYAAILESQASQTIKPIVMRNNAEWIELHRGIMILCQKFYHPNRTWTVQGKERVRTYFFEQANLLPGYDVAIDEEDSLSRNPALRLEQALNLLQYGVFNDERTGMPDMRLFRRVAGLRLPGVGPDSVGGEYAYAASIPEMLKRGQPYYPQPWDNARIIAEELLSWLTGEGRSADPSLVQQVGQIWQACVFAIAQAPMPTDGALMPQAPLFQQPQGQNQARGEASQTVKVADNTGESMAKPTQGHEG
jgi:hypothetical protein